jgi:hypothetical protein
VNADDFDAKSFSQWIDLDEGQLYYIEAQLVQGGGEVHLTVGFEVAPDTPIADHPLSKKQKHAFTISQAEGVLKRDTTTVTITGAASWSGNYTLALAKPAGGEGDPELYMAGGITLGGSAQNLKDKIAGFYHEVWGAAIDVQMECFDANAALMADCDAVEVTVTGAECLDVEGDTVACDSPDVEQTVPTTTETPLLESKVYTITVLKSIPAPSCTLILVAGTAADVTVVAPSVDDGTTSSAPLTGSYWIRCYDQDGYPHETPPIGWGANRHHVQATLTAHCPFLRDGVEVLDGDLFQYNEDGIDFIISFPRIVGELPLFEVWTE